MIKRHDGKKKQYQCGFSRLTRCGIRERPMPLSSALCRCKTQDIKEIIRRENLLAPFFGGESIVGSYYSILYIYIYIKINVKELFRFGFI